MSAQLIRPVVVGVDGTEDGDRALRFAVEEARRLHTGLRIVSAIPEYYPVTPMLPTMRSERFKDTADRIVGHAEAEAERLGKGTIAIDTVVRYGSAVHTLVDVAHDARLIVLGHRQLNHVDRIFSGSTTIGVAARAECPVVSVTNTWPREQTAGKVVVGIDGSSASSEVLRAAFEAASERQAALVVLHAWELPSAYADLVESSVTAEEWRTESAPVVSEVLAGWQEQFPDVKVDVVLRYQRTVDALVAASADADLVVVGRHGHGGWAAGITGVPFGSVARAVLAHAHCPVEVAPHVRVEAGERPGRTPVEQHV
jgi:nucleotide-binding universal stress UspA family protein